MKLNQATGFTLVEVLIVIALISVIGFLAVLNTMSSAAAYQLETSAENLVQSLREARTEAVARNTTVDILLSANGQDCLIRQLDPDDTNTIVAVLSLRPIDLTDTAAGINLAFTAGFNDGVTRVIFNNRGRIINLAAGATSATLTLTSAHLPGRASTVTLWPQTGFIRR